MTDPHEPAVKFACPVCGYRGLWQRPYERMPSPPYPDFGDPPYTDRMGNYSHEGCHGCGYRFGYDDDTGACGTPRSFRTYRREWIADGARWWSSRPQPADWAPAAQLLAAGILDQPMLIRAALFDFDGTLADSFAAITASTNHVRGLHDLPALTEEQIRSFVGFGLDHLLKLLVPGVDPATAVEEYRAHHPSVMAAGTHLFPGVRETLAALHGRGIKLGLCSNKSVGFTRQLILDLGLGEFFPVVLGPEDVGIAKPHPAMLLEACRRLDVPVDATVYVGDMAVDLHTARAAGMPVWLVPYGATGRESATDAHPDRWLRDFSEIAELIVAPSVT